MKFSLLSGLVFSTVLMSTTPMLANPVVEPVVSPVANPVANPVADPVANPASPTNSSATTGASTAHSEVPGSSVEMAGTAGSGSETAGMSSGSGTAPVGASPTTNTVPSSSPSQALGSGQTGIIQVNNSGFGALSQPSCGIGTCFFGTVRMQPNSLGINSEAVLGVVWRPGGSPEDRQMEAQRQLAKAQSESLEQESTLSLTEKLAEAIEQQKFDRATLLAMMLAPRLGYKDHLQLLRQLDGNRSSRQGQPGQGQSGQALAVFGKVDH